MDKYLFVNNQFLPIVLKDAYIASGMWDEENGVFVSEEIFQEYNTYKEDKIRVVGEDGMPAWQDKPAKTTEELLAEAEIKRKQLLANADYITRDWRTELALDIISDEDKKKLIEWMAYIKALKALVLKDVNSINWPEEPAV